MPAFSAGVAGKLAEKWVSGVLTPAFGFWLGSFLVLVYDHRWTSIWNRLNGQSEPLQIALLVVAFLIVSASADIVSRFDARVIRLLEGYWPSWTAALRRVLVRRRARRAGKIEQKFQTLAQALSPGLGQEDALAPELIESHAAMERVLRRVPVRQEEMMPTALGERLRAAERLPLHKYGLDAVVCWPRLWLLLADGPKRDVAEARQALNLSARFWLWGLLFLVWIPWAWWAAVVGLGTMVVSYRNMVGAAEAYGDIVEAAFDVHRAKLYEALRWPLPANAAEELRTGKELTRYLWRGSEDRSLAFADGKMT